MSSPSTASRSPTLFYGWVIVSVGVTAMFAATFTGGAGFSVFLQPMARDLEWPRALLAGGLSLGTLTGALVAPFFGALADRFGARLVLTLCGLGIALALAIVSTVTEPLPFLLAFGFSRAIDMGALNVAVSTSVSNWFVRQRGRALGIAMAGNAVGVVFLVPVAQWIITTVGWRSAWLILGGGTGLLLAVSAAVFLRHKPEDMGLEPDGNPTEKAPDGRTIPDEPSWSVREASHSRSFWLLVMANAFGQAAISGLTIHQAALLESNGVSASIAALAVSAYGLTWAIGSIAWGRLAERFPSNSALAVSFAIVAVCAFGAPHIHWDALALAFSLLYGLANGGKEALDALVWADYFGRRSVGGIRGLSRPFVIGASASGPVLGGLGYDFFKSYSTIVLLFSALAAIGAAAALVSRRPSTRH
ncbi:MAG TPA: MFS transporter [Chloroflexota bacterium]|nr:MFS transporter [Chloroflexota bacterium]